MSQDVIEAVESKAKPLPEASVAPSQPPCEARIAQMLLTNGMFPGNVAPQVIKSWQYLEGLAVAAEKEASRVIDAPLPAEIKPE